MGISVRRESGGRRRLRRLWLLGAAWAVAATAQVPGANEIGTNEIAPGTPIVAVRIERHEVCDLDDPATSAAAYRWVDALHALTRETFIRSLLLFEVGDPFDSLLF